MALATVNKIQPPLQVLQSAEGLLWTPRNQQDGKGTDAMHPYPQYPPGQTGETAIRRAKGEKIFACTYCSYKTIRRGLLENHIRTHTGERPYACPYCPYTATQKTNLTCHIRTHTGEKPYTCPYCSYRAAKKNNLKDHLLQHASGEFTSSDKTT